MNKNFENALSNYNFTFDKYSGYGHINNYEVNITLPSPFEFTPNSGLTVFITTRISNEQFDLLKSKAKENKITRFVRFNANSKFGFTFFIAGFSYKSISKKTYDVISIITTILSELGAPNSSVCPFSELPIDETNSGIVKIKDFKIRAHNNVVEQFDKEIEVDNKKFNEKPNNYFMGFLGAFLGACLAVVLTIAFEQIGFISAISSAIGIYVGSKLYVKFGGKPTNSMITICLITTAIAILGYHLALYTIYASSETGIKGFEAFRTLFGSDEKFRGEFIYDLILDIVFLILGGVGTAFSLAREIRRPTSSN